MTKSLNIVPYLGQKVANILNNADKQRELKHAYETQRIYKPFAGHEISIHDTNIRCKNKPHEE
jgi:hypothetical protein